MDESQAESAVSMKKLHGTLFSRLGCLAAGDAINALRLSFDAGISSRGTVWSFKSNAASSCFNSEQCSRGQGRISRREFRQFLGIARGSCSEPLTPLEIARALKFGGPELIDEAEALSIEVRKMLFGMLESLEKASVRERQL